MPALAIDVLTHKHTRAHARAHTQTTPKKIIKNKPKKNNKEHTYASAQRLTFIYYHLKFKKKIEM